MTSQHTHKQFFVELVIIIHPLEAAKYGLKNRNVSTHIHHYKTNVAYKTFYSNKLLHNNKVLCALLYIVESFIFVNEMQHIEAIPESCDGLHE